MATYTYPQSECLLLVPMQYRRKGTLDGATQYAAFDGDRDTLQNIYTVATDIKLSFSDATGVVKWLLIDGHSTAYASAGSTSAYVNGSLGTLASPYLYEESGYTGQFSRVANTWRRLSGGVTERSCLVRLSNTAATADVRYNMVSAPVSGNPTCRGLIFSEEFRVPMYDVGWSAELSFPDRDSRTSTGFLGHDMTTAKSVQAIERYSFTWSNLTSAQRDTFDDFLDAFGGNLAQPWCLIVLNGNDTMQTPLHLLIEEGSISTPLNERGEYSVSFSAKAVNVSY